MTSPPPAPPKVAATEATRAESAATTPTVQRLARWLIVLCSLVNLAGVLCLLVLLCVISERWWFSLALTYLPRAPYLVPSLLLTAAALLVRRRRWVFVNLFSLFLVAGPIMGFRVPWAAWTGDSDGKLMTVVSCNIEVGRRDVNKIIREIEQIGPDVVVLQEAAYGYEPMLRHLKGWSIVHKGELLVASKYPVKLRETGRSDAFHRVTAMLCEVEGPDGPFLLCDVHLTTARHGLSQLRIDSILTGAGVHQLELRQDLRSLEAFETRAFASQYGIEIPLLIVGDFNVPTSSSLFQKYWSDLTSAFDAGGWGYGYTSPCDEHRRWLDNTPWLRIDHILCSSQWDVERSWIGSSDGSDHRLVAAQVRLNTGD